jgi:hypothetical protein
VTPILQWAATQAPQTTAFEVHLSTQTERFVEFQQFCQELSLGCLVINLDQGAVPVQPMASFRQQCTPLLLAEKLEQLESAFHKAGFLLSRLKVEAPLETMLPAIYYEFHIKLVLSSDFELLSLDPILNQHHARLSRNALKQEEDGYRRFVSLRLYPPTQNPNQHCDRMVAELVALLKEGVRGIHREAVLFDSNEALDHGWLQPIPKTV